MFIFFMLCSFIICDFVIVYVLDFDLVDGFIVFMGEIGVGKFILIDVFVFMLGECVDVVVVCEGVLCVDIIVEFDVYLYVVVWFEVYELYDDEGVILLCCMVDVVGCSKVFINGVVVMLV